MSANTSIEWATHTFNPWWGCTKVKGDPACGHCYAETWAKRLGHDIWGDAAPRRFFGDAHWDEPLKWNAAAQRSMETARVFCASMADVFEDRRDLDEARARLWRLIELTPFLTWLLLTKRPENFDKLAPGEWVLHGAPTHVQIGVTAGTQKHWDERVPVLGRIPASTKFVSCEPLLGRIVAAPLYGVRQIIVGGESGHGAQPTHPDWVRGLRDACINAGLAFHFKQWGEWAPGENVEGDRRYPTRCYFDGRFKDCDDDWTAEADHGPLMYRVGKKAAGRMLDGRTWEEFPTAREAANR